MNGFLLTELFRQLFDYNDLKRENLLSLQLGPVIIQTRDSKSGKTQYTVTNRPAHLLPEKLENSRILFPLYKVSDDRAAIKTLNLNTAAIQQFNKALKLGFNPSQSTNNSSVCFAESPEVRDDFKISFSAVDLFDYALSVILKSDASEPVIPLPNNEQQFWELVKAGDKIRHW